MAKKTYRIVIPKDVENYRKLIQKIKKENDKRGDASELKDETNSINQGDKDMAIAEQLEIEAEELRRQAEEKTEQRNQLWKKTTLLNERGWRKTLEGKYIKAIHKMGDWGYTIDTSPKTKKPAPAAKKAK